MSGNPMRHEHARHHGGDLADAIAQAGNTIPPGEWLDLSTGINPNPWPMPEIEPHAWTRLPGRRELNALKEAAVGYYGAPSPTHVTAGPGSQAILQVLPRCLPPLPVNILGPTYSGHVSAWRSANVVPRETGTLDGCDPAGITIVVNPNNPDGRIVDMAALDAFARKATGAGGWLVVDEAFADLEPSISAAGFLSRRNVVVVRSFGKFFGLGGIRLGFAISPIAMANRLAETLGPWAVAGPALLAGRQALADQPWQQQQRAALAKAAQKLDSLLVAHGLHVEGGTSLFRLVSTSMAARLHAHLLRHGIYVRQFKEHERWLRFGLPGEDTGWSRLESALSDFAS